MDNVRVANRNISDLSDGFRIKVEGFLGEVWDRVFITEWLRSQERQNYLYSFWRNREQLDQVWLSHIEPRPNDRSVTWTLDSNHKNWDAIDIAFHWSNLYPGDISVWREIADIAKKYQIDWWYDLWGTDKPHLQDNWLDLLSYADNKRKEFNIPLQFMWVNVVISETLSSLSKTANAQYDVSANTITLFPPVFEKTEIRVHAILIHEIGHRVFAQFVPRDVQRVWWYKISPKYWYVTPYAKKNPFEDFSECLEEYWIRKQKGLDMKWNEWVMKKVNLAVRIYNNYVTDKNRI